MMMPIKTEDVNSIASLPPLAPGEWTRVRSSSGEGDGSKGGGGDKRGAVKPPRDNPVGRTVRSRRTASLGEDEERLDRKAERRVLLTSAQRRSAGGSPNSSVNSGGDSAGGGGAVSRMARGAGGVSPEGSSNGGSHRFSDSDDERPFSADGGEMAAGVMAAKLGAGVLSPLRSPMRQHGGEDTGGAPVGNGRPDAVEKRAFDRRVSGRSWASLIGMAPPYADHGAGIGTGGAGGVGGGGVGAGAGGGSARLGVGVMGETEERVSPNAMNSPLGQMVMVRKYPDFADAAVAAAAIALSFL